MLIVAILLYLVVVFVAARHWAIVVEVVEVVEVVDVIPFPQ
jgi:hypothetical protein